MKKLIISVFLMGCISMSAQNTNSNHSEIKLNVLSTILGTVEIEFERTLNSDSALGISLFSTFDDTGKAFSYDYDSGINGFYRYYFGKKYASGIFVEGFGMFHSTTFRSITSRNEINNNLLLGAGLGYKWVSEKGIVLQANFSPGFNLFEDEFDSYSGRAGISLGYRF